MFWNDPNLYGATLRDIPNPAAVGLWHNIPKFYPQTFGYMPQQYNMGQTFNPYVRPDMFRTEAVMPQLTANPFAHPFNVNLPMYNRPEMIAPHMAYPYVHPFQANLPLQSWYRPFTF